MKRPASTTRRRGAWCGHGSAWLVAWYCCTATAQMLAPNPNPGVQEPPPTKTDFPVHTVLAPTGLVLERVDAQLEVSPAAGMAQVGPGGEQSGRYRVVTAPNGGRVLELLDGAPAPASDTSKPPAFVIRANGSGQAILELADEMPAPKRPEPPRRVVDVRADSLPAAIPRDPEPDVLYRVVRPK